MSALKYSRITSMLVHIREYIKCQSVSGNYKRRLGDFDLKQLLNNLVTLASLLLMWQLCVRSQEVWKCPVQQKWAGQQGSSNLQSGFAVSDNYWIISSILLACCLFKVKLIKSSKYFAFSDTISIHSHCQILKLLTVHLQERYNLI